MSAVASGGYAEWKGKEAPSDDAMELAVWAYHDMPRDAVRAINTCARKVDALVQRKVEEERERQKKDYRDFAEVLRRHWTFGEWQNHTHSWHDREDFIERHLPGLLAAIRATPNTGG